MRYKRNRIYISTTEQLEIKNYKIFLAGCGIGSVIAECALRMGFENITIADGDVVESSNLNRQNYENADIKNSKAESLKKRLLSINPDANITTHNFYLTCNNIEPILQHHNVAINALDFETDIPFAFDELCQQKNIPVLHPYNIGWAALIFVIMPDGLNLSSIAPMHEGFEKSVISYFLNSLEPASENKKWIEKVLIEYEKEGGKFPPPQLSPGSWMLGGSCATILFRLVTNAEIKQFPKYYFITTE